MKKFSSLHKGFTLVELMIVIAIIGILAAVLYPAMTGYFERSRDTNRQGALRNISLSLAAYNTDNSKNPDEAASGGKCTDALKDALAPATGQKYINSLPVDPKNGHGVDECKKSNTVSGFGYKTLSNGGSDAASYALSANMETKGNANISEENYKNYTTIEDMGKAQKGNTATLPDDTAAGKWYYVVAQ